MNILGINAYHGDASAALVVDGQLVSAVEEERFNRIKHWAGFPSESIRYCLDVAGSISLTWTTSRCLLIRVLTWLNGLRLLLAIDLAFVPSSIGLNDKGKHSGWKTSWHKGLVSRDRRSKPSSIESNITKRTWLPGFSFRPTKKRLFSPSTGWGILQAPSPLTQKGPIGRNSTVSISLIRSGSSIHQSRCTWGFHTTGTSTRSWDLLPTANRNSPTSSAK